MQERSISCKSVVLAEVSADSPAVLAGLQPGDRIALINGHPVEDLLDLRFHLGDDGADLVVDRGGSLVNVRIDISGDSEPGWEVEPLELRTCKCDCIFCFVDQQPENLRPALYLKDEDYRFSFLFGNYLTLVGLSGRDLERIFRLKLSPLYVSIHATDPGVRGQLLGLKSAPVLPRLKRLIEGGIEIHGQIVLVPEINDGPVLEQTLEELRPLYPGLVSLSVVPVGLTRHRYGLPHLRPVDRDDAVRTLGVIGAVQEKMLKGQGTRWVFPADELLIKTDSDIPSEEYYEDYPQIENGVGLIRWTLDRAADALEQHSHKERHEHRIIWVTGRSAFPFLSDLARKISELISGLEIEVVPADNRLMGESVTVAGLLGGGDIKFALEKNLRDFPEGNFSKVYLPPDCTNSDGKLLDDMTAGDMTVDLGVPVEVFDGDWEAMFLHGEEQLS